MRLAIDAPFPRDQIANLVVWSAQAVRLREDWLITIKQAPTDWAFNHSHGIAYPDRRGVVVWIRRAYEPGAPIQDLWSFLAYIITHELTHCAQFERDYPGSSQDDEPSGEVVDAEPEPDAIFEAASIELDRVAPPPADVTVDENEMANRLAFEQLRAEQKAAIAQRREEDEREAVLAGTDRLIEYLDLSLSERDALRFGRLKVGAHWG